MNEGKGIEVKVVNQIEGELPFEEAPIKWILNLNDLSNEGRRGEFQAQEDELSALTKMLKDEDEVEVRSLTCRYHVVPTKLAARNNIEGYEGHFYLRADLQQTCVITLERIGTVVEDEFTQTFTSKGGVLRKTEAVEELEDPFAQDPPLPLLKGRAQIGPLVYQYFAMAIDRNPRKPGVQFEGEQIEFPQDRDVPPSPFNILKDLKSEK